MNWISVKDSLPPMGLPVLVDKVCEVPIVAYRVADDAFPYRWIDYCDQDWLVGVEHWMTLPAPLENKDAS